MRSWRKTWFLTTTLSSKPDGYDQNIGNELRNVRKTRKGKNDLSRSLRVPWLRKLVLFLKKKGEMKKFLFILGIVVITGCIFCGGLLLGLRQQFWTTLFRSSTMDKQLAETSVIYVPISQLEEGKVNDAKSFLNTELDSHILLLDEFLKDCPNPQTQQHIRGLFVRIAKLRQQHPAQINATNEVSGCSVADRRVQEILNDALEKDRK